MNLSKLHVDLASNIDIARKMEKHLKQMPDCDKQLESAIVDLHNGMQVASKAIRKLQKIDESLLLGLFLEATKPSSVVSEVPPEQKTSSSKSASPKPKSARSRATKKRSATL